MFAKILKLLHNNKMKKIFGFIWEVAKIIIISLAIVIPIRYFVFQPFFVKGASMEPNFDNGQYLIIDEISKRFKDIERGEVIVFRFPHDPSQYYIKRVIGLPGETVEIKDGYIYVYNKEHSKGFKIDEHSYLPAGYIITGGDSKIILDEREYFVLGDNRGASSDSRRWGAVPEKYIIGRVFLRAWPINKFQLIKNPAY